MNGCDFGCVCAKRRHTDSNAVGVPAPAGRGVPERSSGRRRKVGDGQMCDGGAEAIVRRKVNDGGDPQ